MISQHAFTTVPCRLVSATIIITQRPLRVTGMFRPTQFPRRVIWTSPTGRRAMSSKTTTDGRTRNPKRQSVFGWVASVSAIGALLQVLYSQRPAQMDALRQKAATAHQL